MLVIPLSGLPVPTPVSDAPRILIIEDHPADALLTREALIACGHACHFAFVESFSEAEAKLLEPQRWHLIISDMVIAGLGAEDFIRWVRSEGRHQCTPIIVYSGFHDPMRAYLAGANAFIAKPSEVDELFTKINSLMTFWLRTAILPFLSKAP